VPPGRGLAVVMTGGVPPPEAAIVIVNSLVAVPVCSKLFRSLPDTDIFNVRVPAAVGVPEMTPVEVFRLNPAGRVPSPGKIYHSKRLSFNNPVWVSVTLYAVFTVPLGRLAVVMFCAFVAKANIKNKAEQVANLTLRRISAIPCNILKM